MNATIADKQKPTAASSKAMWLRQARQFHLYLGTFFAPSIIFFALSGALQLFGLHQGRPGEAYQPPTWIVKMGTIHKNQNMADKRPPAGANPAPKPPREAAEAPKPAQPQQPRRRESKFTLPLKIFFLGTSIGLIFTTVLGIYMAFKFNRSRTVIWSLLITGTAIPGALIALMA